MTELLERAWSKASALPEAEQDMLAREIITELEWEDKWQQAESGKLPPAVAGMANEALAEHRDGKTKLMENEQL